jgi:hypothetical protein
VDVNGDPTGQMIVEAQIAVRFGDVVTVIDDCGWDGGSEIDDLQRFTGIAVTRLQDWLR